MLSIYRCCGDIMKSTRGEIKKFVRDALESRGVVQEIKTVEIHDPHKRVENCYGIMRGKAVTLKVFDSLT